MNKVRNYIDTNFDIQEEYFAIFNKSVPIGKMFCPFHVNNNTPAAKRYDNHIHCFSCNRSYGVYDLLNKYNPNRIKEISSSQIFDSLKPVLNSEKPVRVNIDRTKSIKEVLDLIKSNL